jgi:UDP-3-O-[3-hydroxymyristoyl] glucosamine N-acyltransferase
MTETVGSLATLVNGVVHGDAARPIVGVGDLRIAGPDRIGFLRNPAYAEAAKVAKIGALIVAEPIETQAAQIVVKSVDAAFARVALQFHPVPVATEHRIEPGAVVHPDAVLEAPVQIGSCAVVEKGARLGAGTVLFAGAVVGAGCRVGRQCTLYARAVLYPGVTLGDRVIVHSGAVVGADGFGYARDEAGAWIKWPQLGDVVIEDDVELGANVTIDRAALGTTRIGRGTKLDNLVHIGHNCVLGEHVAVAGLSALAGSVTVGNRVQIGGHTVSAGHLHLVDDVRIAGNSAIVASVTEPGDWMGSPLMEKGRWLRTMRSLGQLVDIAGHVRRLLKRVAVLEGKRDGGGDDA